MGWHVKNFSLMAMSALDGKFVPDTQADIVTPFASDWAKKKLKLNNVCVNEWDDEWSKTCGWWTCR